MSRNVAMSLGQMVRPRRFTTGGSGKGDILGCASRFLERPGEKEGPYADRGRLIGRIKGSLNSKLLAVTDADRRPLRFFMTRGQVSGLACVSPDTQASAV